MAQRTSRLKRSIVIIVATVLGLGVAGVAIAYWTSTGEADGTATTGTSDGFTVTPAAAAGELAPGGPDQTVAFTVTNPGTKAQYLTSVTVTIENVNGTPWVPPVGCDAADYSATITTAPPVGDIAVNGVVNGEATVELANTAVNQDACQGEVVPLHFVAA
jgi:hypothetical protein